MTSLALSVPAPRLAEPGRPRLAICARTVRPPRAEAAPKPPAKTDEDDDDLGPWVRLPDGGLEFRG
jgi:hypothetical protein